jgi:dihydroorotate dehydrogenase electron transfer subunit
MKKYVKDLTVVSNERLHERHVLLKLTDALPLPHMLPGQFVELKVEGSGSTFLRRPISINFVDYERNELWLLIQTIGEGTRKLAALQPGDSLNVVFPLGNGFTMPASPREKILLVGGGVGIAPLLYFGEQIARMGGKPVFLLGARTKDDLLLQDTFRKYGEVHVTTEDGSMGSKGFVTQHPLLARERFDRIATCGPKPMMMAVARYAREHGIACEASLENMMACGVGACLCCVEKTVAGNLCVCKEGPVFDINKLLWQI